MRFIGVDTYIHSGHAKSKGHSCILAEFLTRRPIFPGKTEGSQLIEQIAILGLPTREELAAMSPQMTPHTIEQVHKLDNIQRRDFKAIIAHNSYLVSSPLSLSLTLPSFLRTGLRRDQRG